jgi:hypothetical protein
MLPFAAGEIVTAPATGILESANSPASGSAPTMWSRKSSIR